MKSFREVKRTSKDFDRFAPLLRDITLAIQAPPVLALVERITGLRRQIPDAKLYARGLSMMGSGHFLNTHIDNSHEGSRSYCRTLDLLHYLTPDRRLENGGNLELWDRPVRRNATIVRKFNRLVPMEINPWSWHSVSPVRWIVTLLRVELLLLAPLDYGRAICTSRASAPVPNSVRGVFWPGPTAG